LSSIEEQILAFLDRNSVKYEIFQHDPVYTCERMAKFLKTEKNMIAKSMLIRTIDNKYLLVVLPGNMRVDFDRLARIVKTNSVSLAPVEEAERIAGCSIGCVHPFGNLMGIVTYFDANLLKSSYVFFNPGSHTKSVKISTQELAKLVKPNLEEFVEER
jgi:Ala-tRNA(Pro) deacylase